MEPMVDHWWWRPGWRPGRSFWTFHITFADAPGAHRLARAYSPVFDGLSGLDPISTEWLHLTVQGLGFTDEVDRSDVDAIVAAARTRLAALSPLTITLGPAHTDRESVQMPVHPVEPLARARALLRTAIADVWDAVPEQSEGWRPHVSLAYSSAASPSEPIAERLAVNGGHTAEVSVSAFTLIELNRDRRVYEWTDVATVEFGG